MLSYPLGPSRDWIPWVTLDRTEDADMSCRLCQSEDLRSFGSEVNIHIPGLRNLTRSVLASPTMRVCLRGGFTEFQVNEPELRLLIKESSLLKSHPPDR